VRHEGESVDLAEALRWLLDEKDVKSVLCEGGPMLHGRLREADLADELFLTIAPKLAGGEGPRILEGALPEMQELELVWLLEDEGELFTRYRVRAP
jgi:riboflavin biosynthesis pyrimidine reductase